MSSDTKIRNLLDEIKSNLYIIENDVKPEGKDKLKKITEDVDQVTSLLKGLFQRVDEIGQNIPEKDLLKSEWNLLGSGSFGKVFRGRYKGTPVAIKVLNESEPIKDEEKMLQRLSHNNIVAFRGMGHLKKQNEEVVRKIFRGKGDFTHLSGRFIVMEYISDNLAQYVERQKTHERKGLSTSVTWDIGGQIIHALSYLHTLVNPIAHRDLKPDNILLDTGSLTMHVKLADFGLACHSYQIKAATASGSSRSSGSGSSQRGHVRWSAPETWSDASDSSATETEDDEITKGVAKTSLVEPAISYLPADIYSYGMVLAYMLTGDKPYKAMGTKTLGIAPPDVGDQPYETFPTPESLKGPLQKIVKKCRSWDPMKRPTADNLVNDHFISETNPYQSETLKAEFFNCGFLKGTQIFVADSLVEETTKGFQTTGVRPTGYDKQFLVCHVKVEERPYRDIPEEWDEETREKYASAYLKFREQATKKIIDDNPAIALKELILDRAGEEEEQKVELRYAESTYCHHRAMREVWLSLTESDKVTLVPTKGVINPDYSTSFGLHVAVLTNEGLGNTQKFIFPRRSKREGMSSPGAFTCGAVESCSVKDYIKKDADNSTYVSLLNTAARGLDEELRVHLEGSDFDAIVLNTIYLKFDTHEWGLCGFVDLTDSRIHDSHQLSFNQLKSRFGSGSMKDKFEHEEVHAVDFELESMVRFVRDNHTTFASSAKLVVVKVLQAFFGVEKVEKAFQSLDYAQNLAQQDSNTM